MPCTLPEMLAAYGDSTCATTIISLNGVYYCSLPSTIETTVTSVTILSYSTSVKGLMKRLLRSGDSSCCGPSSLVEPSKSLNGAVLQGKDALYVGCAFVRCCVRIIFAGQQGGANCTSDGGEVARCRLCYHGFTASSRVLEGLWMIIWSQWSHMPPPAPISLSEQAYISIGPPSPHIRKLQLFC